MGNKNPFKMAGAWIGAGIGLVLAIITVFVLLILVAGFGGQNPSDNPGFIIIPAIIIVIGFLVGWGIQAIRNR